MVIEVGDIFYNKHEPLRRVKVVKVGPRSFTVELVQAYHAWYESPSPFTKTFNNKSEKSAFIMHWEKIPKIMLELE